jgi:hypothetical protein
MSRTLRFTLAMLVAATAACAQTTGTSATVPPAAADSLHLAAPAPTDAAEPAALPVGTIATTPPSLASTPMPVRPHVLVIRTQPAIGVERDQMNVLAAAADGDLAAARRARIEVKGTIDIKKKDIDALGARVKAAKQAKDDAARTAADGERKRQESVRTYFERVLDVQEGAVDEAQARGDWARAAIRACDYELQLVGRSGIPSNDGDPVLFKLEQQYLDALKARGAAEERFANRVQTLADRKQKLYRAWADWLGGR